MLALCSTTQLVRGSGRGGTGHSLAAPNYGILSAKATVVDMAATVGEVRF